MYLQYWGEPIIFPSLRWRNPTPKPELLQQVRLRFRVGFLLEPHPDVPDKQQNLYAYLVEILLYVQRCIVPPTVDNLLDQRVHVV